MLSMKAPGIVNLTYAYDGAGNLLSKADSITEQTVLYAYDPWGRRVDPEDWAQADTTHTDVYHINRGYTMHEHLREFGLINMNGRVFDPAVAQFLSTTTTSRPTATGSTTIAMPTASTIRLSTPTRAVIFMEQSKPSNSILSIPL